MRTRAICASLAVVFLPLAFALGQGSLTYDQQSATDESPQSYGAGGPIQQSVLQSFIPTLSTVGFFKLKLNDNNPFNSLGATVYVNLRSGSISGPILGSTDTVTMSDSFTGVTNFIFSTAITVSPGTTYYFEPVVLPGGDTWNIDGKEYLYPRGMAYYQGFGLSGSDLWFREGIIVPEPSASVLLGLGSFVFYAVCCRKKVDRSF